MFKMILSVRLACHSTLRMVDIIHGNDLTWQIFGRIVFAGPHAVSAPHEMSGIPRRPETLNYSKMKVEKQLPDRPICLSKPRATIIV